MKFYEHTNPDGKIVRVRLGDGVTLGNGVRLGNGVTLGAEVNSRIAWSMEPHDGWPVVIAPGSGRLMVGCQDHPIEYWRTLTDREAAEMDGKRAVSFWRRYGAMILAAYDATPADRVEVEGAE